MSFTWEHVLYRLYDEVGSLLYVGITHSINTRFKMHASQQPWWHEVAGCRVEFHPDRSALERAERDAIWHERPRHNVMGSLTPPTLTASGRRPASKVTFHQRLSDEEWAWMHGVG